MHRTCWLVEILNEQMCVGSATFARPVALSCVLVGTAGHFQQGS